MNEPSTQDHKVASHFDSISESYAQHYTNGSFFSYYFEQRLKIVFDFLEDFNHVKVLDVGCGPGMMAEYFIKRCFEFYGIDISENMINSCVKKFGHLDSMHFSVGKLQALEFPDSFFDVVLCMGVLEYIAQDELDRAVSELSRVLKPSGTAIFSLSCNNSFFRKYRRMRNRIKAVITGNKDDIESYSYDGLSRAFDEVSFRELLNSHQITDEFEVVYFCINVLPSFLENRLSDKWKTIVSKGLDNIIKRKLKWPYTAFIVKAKKCDKVYSHE
jgi:ubiquinone/menaquinone biosynthesis C-methylase UbiE